MSCLPLQIVDLAFQFADDIVEPFEVLLGPSQPQLSLVAPRVKTGYAGRLFEQRPPGLRLGLNQLADPALPHHGGRTRAGRLVGEQKLHVLGAGFLAVDAVDGTCLALDAARDLQFVGVIEGGRRAAVRVVEKKRHFRCVARRARGRTGEDDVVHAGRAHVLVGAFAHHPAQRFDKVGLAAAVGPDNAGQTALDDKLARLDEGLETEKAQARKLHPRDPVRFARRTRGDSGMAGTSEHAVDNRRHFFNR